MQKTFLKTLVLSLFTALAVICTPATTFAQVTTAGMTGYVRGPDGKPVPGATVTATYLPTNSTFTAVTNEAGRYVFRGLTTGGPYTVAVAANGFSGEPANDITTILGTDIDVNFAMKSDVVRMEKFVASASKADLDAGQTGAGYLLSNERISNKPTSERSLADLISATPMVTMRDTFGDREESQLTAVGQNNRFNSIQIDGSRINDMFGLNATGLASFFNPLSLDTIEQLAVQLSPYDVRQSGFTGASVNAVTKSGTNRFKGSAYTYFRGDHLLGVRLQGWNPRENSLTGAKIIPRLERSTYGATLGGPIIRDNLFFFVSYEKFESTIAGRDPRFAPANETAILTRLNAIASAAGKTIDWGQPVTAQTANTSKDEKWTAKVDWKINNNHKLTGRYTTTEGEVPQFGNFASSSLNINGVTGGIVAAPTGHFYSQTRKEKTYAGVLNSQWSPNLKTELRFSSTQQDQLTPVNTIAPNILIAGVTGTDLLNNTTVTNGSYNVGTEQFRQGNVIFIDTKQMGATADYIWRNFVFTGGYEREQTDAYNLFRQGSYGLVAFRSLADFMNETATTSTAVITRNVYDPNVRSPADISAFATNGIFGQARWDVNPRLNLVAGLRWELMESKTPPLNSAFLAATGFRNDGSPDGTSSISPRVGFNLALDDERKTQLRGGVGHFFGRAPWVIFSNSWNAPGVGSFTLDSSQNLAAGNAATGQLPANLTNYLRTFDPANPIGTGTDNPSLRREVDWVDNGVELPQAWRANLAFEHKLPIFESILSFEVVYSKVDKALFLTNENLRATTLGADGRQRFAGNPTTAANARFAGYTNLIRVQNTDVGDSTYATLALSRPLRNKWGFDVSYTRGKATEAQSIGQTTAGGQWFRNAVFNQNVVEKGTADFEVKDEVKIYVTKSFEFVKRAPTLVSLYYDGRSGNPYSWVFGGDLNGDGQSFNDRVAVPSGLNDPRFDIAGQTAFMNLIDNSELAAYKGGVVPKNASREPWVNRLDLKFQQVVPLYGRTRLTLFLDWVNFGSFISKKLFGYTELAPSLSNGVFRTRTLTNGTRYGPDGRIQVSTYSATYRNPTTGATRTDAQYSPTPAAPDANFTQFVSRTADFVPTGFGIDNGMSRWRIQLGAKIEF